MPVGQVDVAGLNKVEAIEEPGRSTRGCAAGPGRVHHLGDLMLVLHSRKAGSKELVHSAGADTGERKTLPIDSTPKMVIVASTAVEAQLPGRRG